MKTLVLLVSVLLTGCIRLPHAPNPPAGSTLGPAPTPEQVSSCNKTRNWHNTWVILGTTFGGLAGSGGAADALTTDRTAQTAVGVSVIASGILAAVSTAAAGIEAQTYAEGNCATILSEAVAAGIGP
jgi:hypothetical protein